MTASERRWAEARERARRREMTRYMVEGMIRERSNPESYGYTREAFEEAIERYGMSREAA